MVEMYKLARPMMRGAVVEIINGKPQGVNNRMVNDILGGMPQFKGELVVGKPIDPECREMTQLFLDDETFMAPFVFWVYDIKTTGVYDLQRRLKIAEQFVLTTAPCIQYVDHELIQTQEELAAYIEKVVSDNFFPGVVLREPFGTYGTQDQELTQETGALH